MAGENPAFLSFVRTLRCRMWMHDTCDGAIEAHHAGERGLGQRAHDDTAIPLCLKHHRAWHDANGVFKTWNKLKRRIWRDQQIRWTQKEFKIHRFRIDHEKEVVAKARKHRRALIAERARVRKEPRK